MKCHIVVVGLGYVGLPTALVFASKGFRVVGVDVDQRKVDMLKKGKCYLREKDVAMLLKKVIVEGSFTPTTEIGSSIENASSVIVCVPTPVIAGEVNLSFLEFVLRVISDKVKKGQLIVVESTVPPGTTVNFVKPILESSGLTAENDFYLAYVPERIAPGNSIRELLNLPRLVGGVGPKSTRVALELYRKVNPNVIPCDSLTAELSKLAENTFRDLNIAFANLLAMICECIGADAKKVIELANTHPRVSILRPGPGVGGPCLTKDPYMLLKCGEQVFGIKLIKIAREINDYMPIHTVALIEHALSKLNVPISKAKIAILGVAYKGGVDDTRCSPSEKIISELIAKDATVVAYDPYTEETFGARHADSIEEAVKDADAVVIVTDHPEFMNLDLSLLSKFVRHRVLIDCRRLIDAEAARKLGFKYYGIGLGVVDE